MEEDKGHQKRKKIVAYVAVFLIIATISTTLVLAFTLFRVKAPKFRITGINVETISSLAPKNPTYPIMTVTFLADLSLKNTNFGRYEFEKGSVTFTSEIGAMKLGDTNVSAETAKARATRTRTRTVEVTARLNVTALHVVVDHDGYAIGIVYVGAYSKLKGNVLRKILRMIYEVCQ